MSNYVLICHGGPREYSSFDLSKGQEVHYRGNYGAPLGSLTALAIWKALKANPSVTDEQLARGITGYNPPDVLRGPGTVAPDFNLSGDDNLFLFLLNMGTGKYLRLGTNWRSKLSTVVAAIGPNGKAFWLNLLCCSEIEGSGVEMPSGVQLVSRFEDIV